MMLGRRQGDNFKKPPTWKHLFKILSRYTLHRVYLSLACIVQWTCLSYRANLISTNNIKLKFCEKFDTTELVYFPNVRVTCTKKFIQLDQSVFIHRVLDKFANFIVSPHKSRKCPPPSDAADWIAKDQGHLSAQEQM